MTPPTLWSTSAATGLTADQPSPPAAACLKVALLHNTRPASPAADQPDDACEEYDTPETIKAIIRALSALNVEVEPVEADRNLPWRLQSGGYDFAFNIAEGRGRRCREGIPAAICELLGIPFTGSDMLTLAATLDKAAARRLVSPEVPVARAVLVQGDVDERAFSALSFPVMVKPNDEGSSKGIRDGSVVADAAAAVERAHWLRDNYGCPVLVEEFLAGPEVTVGIAGNGAGTRILGMMEVAPAEPERHWTYSVDVKRDWRRRVRYHVPPRLDAQVRASLEGYALAAYRLLSCRDLARMDFRLDAAGAPHFLECNPLPGLNPDSGDIMILSQPKLTYEHLVQGVLLDAARRFNVGIHRRVRGLE